MEVDNIFDTKEKGYSRIKDIIETKGSLMGSRALGVESSVSDYDTYFMELITTR